MRNTSTQIQAIITTLDTTKFTYNDMYLTYIDFKNTTKSIDHPNFAMLIADSGYPPYAIELIANMYTESSTSYIGAHLITTQPIQTSRNTIKGDTLSL